MIYADDKINIMLNEKRVKLHIFEPSNRKIWTIVGKGKEHWLNPDLNYCSCPGFYFNENKNNNCYHLYSIKQAQRQNKFEVIHFSDDEFDGFIAALVVDI